MLVDDAEGAVLVDHQILGILVGLAAVEDPVSYHIPGVSGPIVIPIDGQDGVGGLGDAAGLGGHVPPVDAVCEGGLQILGRGEDHVRHVYRGIIGSDLLDGDGDVPVGIAVLRRNYIDRFGWRRGGLLDGGRRRLDGSRRGNGGGSNRCGGLRLLCDGGGCQSHCWFLHRCIGVFDHKGIQGGVCGETEQKDSPDEAHYLFSLFHGAFLPAGHSVSASSAFSQINISRFPFRHRSSSIKDCASLGSLSSTS